MTDYERIGLLMATASVVLNLVVFITFVWQLKILVRQVGQASTSTRLDHSRRRKQATLEFYANTMARRAELRNRLPNDYDSQGIAKLLVEEAADDGEIGRAIAEYLTMHELLATGVRTGVFDIAVIWRAAGGRVVSIARNYQPWIDRRRQGSGQVGLFAELEWLAVVIERSEDGEGLPECFEDPMSSLESSYQDLIERQRG